MAKVIYQILCFHLVICDRIGPGGQIEGMDCLVTPQKKGESRPSDSMDFQSTFFCQSVLGGTVVVDVGGHGPYVKLERHHGQMS
jgi:hypothetical protein